PGDPLLWTQDINNSTGSFFNALNQRRQLTSPTPDFLFAYFPGNPYSGNGSSIIGGRVAFGNTELARDTRTFAHQLGHHFRPLAPEVGVDVDNAIGLGRIKPSSLKDIMYPGLLTNQAFVDVPTYSYFYNSPILRCPGGSPGRGAGDYLFVTGVIDEAGRASLS